MKTKKYQKVAWQNQLSKATNEKDVNSMICPHMLYHASICTHNWINGEKTDSKNEIMFLKFIYLNFF